MFSKSYRYLSLPTVLAMMVSTGIMAAEVSLTGQASIQYTPDSARLQFTASAEHPLPQTATERLREQMAQWREGIADYRDQMGGYSDASLNLYSRRIPPREQGQETQTLAVASQTVSFTIDNLSLLNPILEQAQAAGMDYNLGPHNFFHSDESGLGDQALAGAIADARARCEFVANELGQRCGDVVTINIDDGHRPPVAMMAEMRGASDMVADVGPRELQSRVSATFELE